MAHFAIVTTNPTCPPATQVTHDLRNILASIGLHLETLQRLSGPSGVKAADAAYTLLTRATILCNSALDCSASVSSHARRRRVDLVQTARQISSLLDSSAPKDFSFDIDKNSVGYVLADPDDVFRILFNLMSNAVNVASREESAMKSVTIRVSTESNVVTAQVSDDGPGLPACVQSRLFRPQSKQSKSVRHGYGLAIARELAERNGGTLTLAPAAKGVNFQLKLAAFVSVFPRKCPTVLWPPRSGLVTGWHDVQLSRLRPHCACNSAVWPNAVRSGPVMRFVRNRHHVLFHWTEALPASRPTQPCIGLCSDRSAVTGGNRPIAVAGHPVRTLARYVGPRSSEPWLVLATALNSPPVPHAP